MPEVTQALKFGSFELNPRTHELRSGGRAVRLQLQPARVLGYLAGRPDRLVTRDELRAHIWGKETFVDFNQNLNYCIAEIRRALGDQAHFIETAPRQGYRFIARLERAPEATRSARIVIAVLPIVDLSRAPHPAYLADSLTEEMIAHLGSLDPRGIGVIARTSVMKYRGSQTSIAEIATALGADYVVEGSIRRVASRAKGHFRLVRASTQTRSGRAPMRRRSTAWTPASNAPPASWWRIWWARVRRGLAFPGSKLPGAKPGGPRTTSI